MRGFMNIRPLAAIGMALRDSRLIWIVVMMARPSLVSVCFGRSFRSGNF
jgi:hypothetical protein